MKMNPFGSPTRSFRGVFFLMAAMALLLTACQEPSVSITARIADFLDDLENERYGSTIARHFHSDVQTSVNTQDEWKTSRFRSDEADSYSWSEGNRSESSSFGGTTRVSGTLSIRIDDGADDSATIDFYMKTEDGNWMIRAIDDDPDKDGVLIESIRPLFEQ